MPDNTESPSAARTAVVTGGGTGIGRATAQLLTDTGYRVVVVGRRAEVVQAAATDLGAIAVAADLTLSADVERAAEEIVTALGTVDALVLNAGGSHHGSLDSTAEVAAHWMATMEQNVLSAVLLTHALRSHLRRPGGRIVAVSSAAARSGGGEVAYGASKAALSRWILSMASELGPDGITVNALSPGFVPDTELYSGGMDPAWTARVAKGIAVQRVGTPEDIADGIRWLVSPGAGFVNGTVVEIDGGRAVRV
jgi:3-oxoacyl-[acyl-carrier protein] reductase